jgi:hypothetical protein
MPRDTRPKDTGIYLIENTVEKALYVGRTGHNIKQRIANHLIALRRGIHPNRLLQEAYDRLGPDAFTSQPAEVGIPKEDLAEAERRWIHKLRAEGHTIYNVYDRGEDIAKRQARHRRIKLEPPVNRGERVACPEGVVVDALTHECVIRCDQVGEHTKHGITVRLKNSQEFWGWS